MANDNSLMMKNPLRRGLRYLLDAEGGEAASQGQSVADNPYQPGTIDSIGWLDGWNRVMNESDGG